MYKVIIPTTNFGQFDWSAEYTLTQEQAEAMLPFAGLQILQRVPSSKAEASMAIELGLWEKDAKGNWRRPKGFKRSAIPYSDKHAEVLQKGLSKLEIPFGKDADGKAVTQTVDVKVTVSRHESSAADLKFDDERAVYASKGGDAEALQSMATKVGYTGDLGDGTSEGAPVDFLRAIRNWKNEQARIALKGLGL